MNEKLWECPRCGTQMTSPESVYEAVCACLTYAAPLLPLVGSMPVTDDEHGRHHAPPPSRGDRRGAGQSAGAAVKV